MPIVQPDTGGLRRAGRALDAGEPVVLPLPTPLPYAVAATDAAAANVAKGRPAGQPAGMAVAGFGLAAPFVELDEQQLAFARWLTAHEQVNLLLPLRAGAPEWMAPSTSRGWLGLTLAWLDEARELLDPRGHLYLSSANRTGGDVAVTAPAAEAAFAGELLVVDGDPLRDPRVPSGSATMIRVGRDRAELVRHGVQDAGFAGDFLDELTRRWERGRQD